MNINTLITSLRKSPDNIEFKQVIDLIHEHYDYSACAFQNGDIMNEAGSNEGSCKIFYFAQLNSLSELETLALFGHYYRDDVMGNPAGDDHGNIRNFILDGWLGLKFDGVALALKSSPKP